MIVYDERSWVIYTYILIEGNEFGSDFQVLIFYCGLDVEEYRSGLIVLTRK